MARTEQAYDADAAPPVNRAFGAILTGLLLVMVIVVAGSILGTSSLLSGAGASVITVVLGLVVIATGVLSLSLLGERAGSGRGAKVLRAGYPYALVVLTVSLAISDTPVALPLAAQIALRALIWAGVACAVALVALPRSRNHRRALLALAAGLPVVYAVTLSVLISPRLGVQALSWPMSLLAAAGVVTVPTLLIWGAVDGLPGSEARAVRLWRLVARRPGFVLAPLGLDLVLVGLVLLLAVVLRVDEPLIRSGASWWVFALLVGGGLLAILALDRRLVSDDRDQAVLARIVTALAGFPLALTVVLLFGVPVLRLRTLSDSATLVLIAVALAVSIVARLDRPRITPRTVIIVAGLAGAVASLGALPHPRSGAHPPITPGSILVLELIFGLGVLAVLIGTAGAALVARRPRVLLLVVVLVVWTLIAAVTGQWGSGPNIITLAIVVIALLGVAAVLWLLGRQQLVDGFEIVLTGLIAAPLWLIPALLRLAPDPWPRWILIATFLGPGIVVAARSVRATLRRSLTTSEVRALALTTLSYAMIAALAWYTGDQAATLADNIATYLLDLFLLPLSVLLILGASARRRAAWAAPDPATAWSAPHDRPHP